MRYTVFKTKWGYFGLAGLRRGLRLNSAERPQSSRTEYVLCRTCLPLAEPANVKSQLSKNLSLISPAPRLIRDKDLFKTLQQQITAYFEGAYVRFSQDIPLALDRLSPFAGSVLTACRRVEFGQIVTYSELAKKLGRPGAARAVGNALAKNPVPLIIPCHRVVCSPPDVWGSRIGGFSAPGGKDLKARLLRHEQASLANRKSH